VRDDIAIAEGRRRLRTFLKTAEGGKALLWLRSITVETVMGPKNTEAELRDHAGRCGLVRTLESLAQEEEPTDDSDD
jgi:hypothetical protein